VNIGQIDTDHLPDLHAAHLHRRAHRQPGEVLEIDVDRGLSRERRADKAEVEDGREEDHARDGDEEADAYLTPVVLHLPHDDDPSFRSLMRG
jgi:hypothetical protein